MNNIRKRISIHHKNLEIFQNVLTRTTHSLSDLKPRNENGDIKPYLHQFQFANYVYNLKKVRSIDLTLTWKDMSHLYSDRRIITSYIMVNREKKFLVSFSLFYYYYFENILFQTNFNKIKGKTLCNKTY